MYRKFGKRAIDTVLSLLALIILFLYRNSIRSISTQAVWLWCKIALAQN